MITTMMMMTLTMKGIISQYFDAFVVSSSRVLPLDVVAGVWYSTRSTFLLRLLPLDLDEVLGIVHYR